ncbi:MAG TPA: Eco57I restriction-modification methylase domain-containing protein [Mucilaginibacter sp.]|nr:Eco57I restriction-modification methylase domain-containing protein [Mucilaginibacter sp.]
MIDITIAEDDLFCERLYALKTDIGHRKKYAQFFTPVKIAYFLSNYILKANRDVNRILEPAFGLGVFSRVLRNQFAYKGEISGFELDDLIISFGKDIVNEYDVCLNNADYLNVWNLSFDCVICNPPYLKFHDYDNLPYIGKINQVLKTKLNGYTNIYALFILKSLSELSHNGRAGYIVPSEFFNADYGVAVKQKLLESKMLKYVVNFHFDNNAFTDVLTTATLLLFENSSNDDIVTFFNISGDNELKNLDKIINDESQNLHHVESFSYHYAHLDPRIKWRNYYQATRKYSSNKLVNFKNYCKAMRGIATGANDYFSFSRSKAARYNIKNENLLNCVCKSSDINKIFFTKNDFDDLVTSDKKVFLVDLRIQQDKDVENYIRLGKELAVHEKFLTKKRKPWYSIENRKPADIWVGVFNRGRLKFIKNDSKALNLTTFHGIYIHNIYDDIREIIFAYFLTDLSKEVFLANRREYGNGLSKYEPNDFNNSDIFDFKTLTESQIKDLNEIIKDIKDNEDNTVLVNINISRLDEYFRALL